jgi:hypothetical protein
METPHDADMEAPMATKDEIQREMESIRSMRRISSQSGPGSIPLDPDLPSHSVGTTEGGGFSIPGIAGLNLPGSFSFYIARDGFWLTAS